ncbi:MAG TPA: hypothetical protein DCQ98_09615 [Planctomycetaceae bacterium]|nr:hypothetical protein [Planctomycetaceae bacterium]
MSLAFLAAYRDPIVFAPATLIVAVDHIVRGLWWPQSVFGITTVSEWRWLEHAAWVIFEDIVLLIVILQSRHVILQLAMHTDRLERREEELKLAIDAAENANRTKSKFLANMSHEIRTPLNGILGFTEVLIRDRDRVTSAESIDSLMTIRRSGQHLLALINDVLDLSKIEADRLQIETIPCSPHQIIADAVSVLRVAAADKGIGLEYRWESPVPERILSDPYRLKQLLLNLIGNAVKFTDQGSVLVVARTERRGDLPALTIEVRDTGIGIAQEKLDAIFQPFVQADQSVTRRYGGTGLGLAIGRRIAEALGGDLTATSQVGRGSTFVARIVYGETPEAAECRPPCQIPGADVKGGESTPRDLTGLSILVVDDGETNRKLLRLLLERCGAEVRTVENGELAIEAAERSDFDVILMDMQMPVLDGYSATARLRERGFDGPIIALTANAMPGDREKCESAGCSGYLPKPIEPDRLFEVLAERSPTSRREPSRDPSRQPSCEPSREPIRSILPTDDPELREIVAEFLATLEVRMEAIDGAFRSNDSEELQRLAHWLKGAAGTVGFSCFTASAAELESLARSGRPSEVEGTIERIRSLQQRLVL